MSEFPIRERIMTGPEHYMIADDLLRGIDPHDPVEGDHTRIAMATAHATLALAAAQALSHDRVMPPTDGERWRVVASSGDRDRMPHRFYQLPDPIDDVLDREI